jgi:hypothetical protein
MSARRPQPQAPRPPLAARPALIIPACRRDQVALAVAAVATLIYKRHTERPRRPWLVWFFDATKQAFAGAAANAPSVQCRAAPFVQCRAAASVQCRAWGEAYSPVSRAP